MNTTPIVDDSNTEHVEMDDEEEMSVEHSGRDSGLANESPRNQSYLETSAKALEVENEMQEKFLSSHKELQEAKRKLEELRLLRFEEKSYLKQEIEQLNEKYGEEERNSSNLERQLKKFAADKVVSDKKTSDLEREQSIGTQINMMQEQEINRLEMRLKDEEVQRYDISRQLDQLRKAILEKDQQRMKQQGEVYILKERITQLDESCGYYKKSADESQQKVWEVEESIHTLSEENMSLLDQVEDAKNEISKLCASIKETEVKITKMDEAAQEVQQNLLDAQTKLDAQISRCEALEEEHRKRESILQQEIENTTFNENKYKDKCEQTERLFHETRREKDEQIFDLQRVADRVPSLEDQILNLESQNADTEFLLNELRDAICRHIRSGNSVAEEPESTATENLSTPGKLHSRAASPCKQVSPGSSPLKSPLPSPVKELIPIPVSTEEINNYFKEANENMRSLQEQIVNLSIQVEQEQTMMADLSTTIGNLRNELGRAQTNLNNNSKMKDTIQDQYQQATETIKLQERNNERKSKENEHLRELIQDCERQLDNLKTELTSAKSEGQINTKTQEKNIAGKNKEIDSLFTTIQNYENEIDRLKGDIKSINTEMLHNNTAHKKEELRLQLVVEGLQNNLQNVSNEQKNDEIKYEEEANGYKEIIENQNKEIKDLKNELENLIEDNKNLAQRLMHLESYSDKLSEMLDKNQTADDKAREKFASEIRDYKQIVSDKDIEIIDLTRKIEVLNVSAKENSDYQEQIDKKLNGLVNNQKVLEETNDLLRKEKKEVDEKLQTVSNDHLKAEENLSRNKEENQILDTRCAEQLKLMEELHERINLLEGENTTLKQSTVTMERGIKLKESLIAELSRKGGEASDTFVTLKNNLQKAETDKKHYENKLNIFRHEKTMIEKTVRENEDEKTYLRDQVSNLQRLLAKAEDEKEVSLGNMAHYQSQVENLRSIKEKNALKGLEGQIQSLRVELNLERQRRERLESRYTKRDDQVSQLRSTFDHSLNTISKDTKNIKSIIGKSLQKIDRIENNDMTDSDFIESDSEAYSPTSKLNTNSKYLSLPSHRTKSLESSLEALQSTLKAATPSSARKYRTTEVKETKDVTKSIPASPIKPLTLIQEAPVRDSYRKSSKRLTR